MLTDTQRAEIVKEAKSWSGTPYSGWTWIKGVGADCGQFLYGVFNTLGYIPKVPLPKDYSLQVSQHRASQEYLNLVDQFFREIPESEAKPGDLVVYKIGLAYAHGAIIVSWPNYILQAELRHGVSGSHGLHNPALRERHYLKGTVREFRTLRDEYCKGN